jgi:hypothetical protein
MIELEGDEKIRQAHKTQPCMTQQACGTSGRLEERSACD